MHSYPAEPPLTKGPSQGKCDQGAREGERKKIPFFFSASTEVVWNGGGGGVGGCTKGCSSGGTQR